MKSDGIDYRDFQEFFQAATGLEPYDWQVRLGHGFHGGDAVAQLKEGDHRDPKRGSQVSTAETPWLN